MPVNEITNFDRLMAKINNLTSSQLDEMAIDAIKKITKAQQRVAKELASVSQSSGGDLRNSIKTTDEKVQNGVAGICYSNSDHASYVEFGTGPIGAASPSSGADVQVTYSLGPWKHISKTGKVYYTDYWTYRTEDGKFYSTRGMPARPFMYPSAMAVKAQAVNIQEKAIKNYLRKLGV